MLNYKQIIVLYKMDIRKPIKNQFISFETIKTDDIEMLRMLVKLIISGYVFVNCFSFQKYTEQNL